MRLKALPHITMLCDGRIYNYNKVWINFYFAPSWPKGLNCSCPQLRREFGFKLDTECDCEVIIHLYNKLGIEVKSCICVTEYQRGKVLYKSGSKITSVRSLKILG